MDEASYVRPAKTPEESIHIKGRYVTLAGVSGTHAPAMFEQLGGSENNHLYDYMYFGPFESLEDYTEEMDKQFARPDRTFYTILLNDDQRNDGKPVGFCAVLSPNTTHRSIEVGVLLYSPTLQRTPASTEAMYLLASYVFDDLGFRRYFWTCNSLNKPSEKAALRPGFTYEGTLRQDSFQKGKSRDTKMFSMLDTEWPEKKKALELWLRPENFDEQGIQRVKLESIRDNIGSKIN